MSIPLLQGCGTLSSMVVRLGRSLYDLKQASRTWHQHSVRGMKCLGFEQCAADACVMRLMEKGTIAMVVVVHVDDMFSTGLKSRREKLGRDLKEYPPIYNLGERRLYAGIWVSRGFGLGDNYAFSAGICGKLGCKVWCHPPQRDPPGSWSEA